MTGLAPEVTQDHHQLSDERRRLESTVQQLEAARATMIPWWRELSRFFAPRATRFDGDQDNRGNALNRHLIDETSVSARRTLSAGLASGITNPSLEWMQLGVADPEIAEIPSVKNWLHVANQRFFAVLAGSNFYHVMSSTYDTLSVYATAAFLVEEDEEDIINCVPFAVGSYCIGDDAKQNVRIFSRKITMTVRQILDRFGTDPLTGREDHTRFSDTVLNAIKEDRIDGTRIAVQHVVYPRRRVDAARRTGDAKRIASCYWEVGASPKDERFHFLAEEGYDEWPLMVYRWARVPDEPWAVDCPGMMVLGTTKSAQKVESKNLKMLEKAVDPPLVGPSSLEHKRTSLLPGELTTVDDRDRQLRAIHEVDLAALSAVRDTQLDMRERIHDAFFTRLMLLVANDQRDQRATAREIEEGSREKYVILGPVLEAWNGTFRLFTDRVFAIMVRRGLLPPAPEELQGRALQVTYTSMMARALKSVGLGNIKEFLAYIAEMAKATSDPRVLRKIDLEQSVDELAVRSGIPPRMVRSDADVAEIAAAEAEAAAEERRTALAAEEAKAAKDLAAADTGGENALTALMGTGAPARGTR